METLFITEDTNVRRSQRRSGVFNVNFEHLSHTALVSITEFKQVNIGWITNEQTKSDLSKNI